MSSYSPPTENLPIFNSTLFYQDTGTGLSQAESDLIYLSKAKTDTSTATLTTFTGTIAPATITTNNYNSSTSTGTCNIGTGNISGTIRIAPDQIVGGNVLIGNTTSTITHNGATILKGTSITDGSTLTTRQIKSSATASALHQLFDNMTTNGVLTIGNTLSSNVVNGATTLNQATTITDGSLLNVRQISSTTPASNAHQLFTNMTTNGVLTIGNSLSTNTINGTTSISNTNCTGTFSADSIAVRVSTGTKNIWTNATGTANLIIGNILAPLTINSSTFTINGTTTFNNGVNYGTLSGSTITSSAFDTNQITGITTICNSATSGTVRLATGLNSAGNIEINSNVGTTSMRGTTSFVNSATFENSGSTTFNGPNTFNGDTSFPARMICRGAQYANEVFVISSVSYTFTSVPMHQRIMLTQPASGTPINITLPTISSSTNAGLEFTFIKTGSITNSVIFTAGGTNQIHSTSTITNVSPYTTMVNTQTIKVFIILEVSAGVFAWKEIV